MDGEIAIITFDLPNEPVNKFSASVIAEFDTMLTTIDETSAIRAAVLISGKPEGFIAGADIDAFLEFRSAQDAADASAFGHRMMRRLETSRAPVVAAIHGGCLGGGLELSLSCRYRVATDHPKTILALPEIQLGLIPGLGGTQRLPRFIGKAKAMDLVLTGRMMDAAEAERCGLVSRVVPLDKLMEEALAAAEKIAGMSLPATMVAKEAVNRAFETTLAEGVRFERRTFHATFAFDDRQEGMSAFADKRKAAWKHR